MAPLSGKGVWLQRIADCEGGDLAAITARARQAGCAYVLVQIADGADDYNLEQAADLVGALAGAGLAVWGWHSIYGDTPLFKGPLQADYHLREAERAAARVGQLRPAGLRGLALYARGDYERASQRDRRAAEFMGRLRQAMPDLPIGLSAWKSPAAHPRFPWAAFREQCDLDLPLVFWIGTHGEAARQLQACADQFNALTPRRPLAPVGPAFYESNWRPAPDDLSTFMAKALELELPAASLWRWDELGLRGDERGNTHQLDFRPHWQAFADFAWAGAAVDWTPPTRPAAGAAALAFAVDEPPAESETPIAEREGDWAYWLAEDYAPAEPAVAPGEHAALLQSLDETDELPAHLRDEAAAEGDISFALPEAGYSSEFDLTEPDKLKRLLGLPAEDDELSDHLRDEPEAEVSFSLPAPDYTSEFDGIDPDRLRGLLGVESETEALPAHLTGEAPDGAEALAFELSAQPDRPPPDAEPAEAERADFDWPDRAAEPQIADAEPEIPGIARPEPGEPAEPIAAAEAGEGDLPEWAREFVEPAAQDEPAAIDFESAIEAAPAPAEWAMPSAGDRETAIAVPAETKIEERPAPAVPSPPTRPAAAAPPAEALHPTLDHFYQALRAARLGEAFTHYGPGFTHVNPDRVERSVAELYEFYQQVLAQVRPGTLAVAGGGGTGLAHTAHWTAQTADGADVQVTDSFNLNRSGQIVYHHTSLRLRA